MVTTILDPHQKVEVRVVLQGRLCLVRANGKTDRYLEGEDNSNPIIIFFITNEESSLIVNGNSRGTVLLLLDFFTLIPELPNRIILSVCFVIFQDFLWSPCNNQSIFGASYHTQHNN